MKTYTLNLKNSKGRELIVTLQVESFPNNGGVKKYKMSIIESSEPCIFGPIGSGYYSTGEAVSKVEHQEDKSIVFGNGEVKRQYSYPFVLWPENATGKNDRYLFTLPNLNKKDFQ